MKFYVVAVIPFQLLFELREREIVWWWQTCDEYGEWCEIITSLRGQQLAFSHGKMCRPMLSGNRTQSRCWPGVRRTSRVSSEKAIQNAFMVNGIKWFRYELFMLIVWLSKKPRDNGIKIWFLKEQFCWFWRICVLRSYFLFHDRIGNTVISFLFWWKFR